VKERDLSRSLSNARARETKPLEVLRYNLSQKDRQDLRERGGDPDDVFALDFPIKFARDFVSKVSPGKRLDQLRQAKQLIADTRAAELQKVSNDLQALGFDWSDAPSDIVALAAPTPPPNVEVKVETDRPNNEVTAGDPIQLRVTVTNKGTTPLYRLYATTKSDNPMFDQKEIVFGKLEPGKSRTSTTPLGWCEVDGKKPGQTAPTPKDAQRVCRIPRDALTRQDGVTVRFEEARNRAPANAQTRVAIKALERPLFAYSYQIADSRKGNGDGRVQKGEQLTMFLTVKNVGRGRSFETQANLRNLSGDGLLLRDGRFDISNMQPGETKKVAFTFDVESQLADPEAKVELSIADRDLRENVVEKVRMAIAPPVQISAGSGVQKAKASGVPLYESPDPGARVFGRLAQGTAAAVIGTAGDFFKLHLGEGRFGFVRSSDMESGGTASANVPFEEAMAHQPPQIELGPVALSTRDSTVSIKGTATDSDRLLDAYIFVGSRKLFYRSNRNGADLKKMGFEAQLPLRPGVNMITVVARENPDTVGRKTFIVRRDGPNGELLATPKTEEDLGEAGGGED
jgi:carboxyl-terminal processing protease